MKCPKCGREAERLLALSRTDNKTMICDECGIREALDSLPPRGYVPAGAGKGGGHGVGK